MIDLPLRTSKGTVGTTEEDFQRAVAMIDGSFGTGYAKDHPDLVSSVSRDLSLRRCYNALAHAVDKHGRTINDGLRRLGQHGQL